MIVLVLRLRYKDHLLTIFFFFLGGGGGCISKVIFIFVPFVFVACQTAIDLAFLIDGSASVERYGIGNFRRLIDFVRDVVLGFRVSRSNTRVGTIVFGTKPYLLFGFNSYTNNGAVFNRLNKGVPYPKSGSRIGKALLMAQRQLFRKNPRRSRVTKVVVVITDGSSMDDVAVPSNALKSRGVRIYCVGVGRYINGRQLDIMASPPRKNHIFTADWTHLGVVVNELRNAICLGKMSTRFYKPGRI